MNYCRLKTIATLAMNDILSNSIQYLEILSSDAALIYVDQEIIKSQP